MLDPSGIVAWGNWSMYQQENVSVRVIWEKNGARGMMSVLCGNRRRIAVVPELRQWESYDSKSISIRRKDLDEAIRERRDISFEACLWVAKHAYFSRDVSIKTRHIVRHTTVRSVCSSYLEFDKMHGQMHTITF